MTCHFRWLGGLRKWTMDYGGLARCTLVQFSSELSICVGVTTDLTCSLSMSTWRQRRVDLHCRNGKQRRVAHTKKFSKSINNNYLPLIWIYVVENDKTCGHFIYSGGRSDAPDRKNGLVLLDFTWMSFDQVVKSWSRIGLKSVYPSDDSKGKEICVINDRNIYLFSSFDEIANIWYLWRNPLTTY